MILIALICVIAWLGETLKDRGEVYTMARYIAVIANSGNT